MTEADLNHKLDVLIEQSHSQARHTTATIAQWVVIAIMAMGLLGSVAGNLRTWGSLQTTVASNATNIAAINEARADAMALRQSQIDAINRDIANLRADFTGANAGTAADIRAIRSDLANINAFIKDTVRK